ncbi:MAG: glutamine synthetase family protein [Rhizobiaceae bacterium]
MALLEDFLKNHPNVDYVELVLVDPNGIVRGKWAPVASLKKAFSDGVNFPLSLHGLDVWGNEVEDTGLHISSGDLDGFCMAVPHTLSAVPWGPTEASEKSDSAEAATTAQILLQTLTPERQFFGGCSRSVLEQVVGRLSARGLSAVCAFELEFHLLQSPASSGEPFVMASHEEMPDAQFMYGLDALAEKAPVFRDIRNAAKWAGLPVDTIVKEAGLGQYEVNLNHRADALRAADDVILLKRIVKECARMNGYEATFMAKPVIGQPGNGMHVHASLLDEDGKNIFAGAEGDGRLRHAVAGLLSSMQEMALVFVNTRNGFRRMAPGSYAPTRVNWGANNRSVSVRLPAAPDVAKRLEHRVSGADANPYLVLAAILQGIDEGLQVAQEPPAELVGNAYEEATPNRGESLPDAQQAALDLFKNSEFAASALGQQMRDNLVAIKQAEIDGFRDDVSPLERRTYL